MGRSSRAVASGSSGCCPSAEEAAGSWVACVAAAAAVATRPAGTLREGRVNRLALAEPG